MPPNQLAVLIIEGRSDYNVLSCFNQEVARSLRKLGIEPVLIGANGLKTVTQEFNKALQDFGPGRIIAAFCFSGMGIEFGDEDPEGNIWQRCRIPILTWMLDHPCYYLSRHQHPSPAVMRLYTTRDFVDFQRDFVRAPFRTAHCRLGMMSHGKTPKRRTPKQGETPLVIFPKSGGSPDALVEKWNKLPIRLNHTLQEAAAHYWQTTPRSGPVVPSVLAAADAAGFELRNDMPLLTFMIAQIDQYIRFRKGDVLIRELLRFPVRIYGKGFDHVDTRGMRATISPPIPYGDLTDQFHEATAVVTMNPNLDDDVHDRVYGAFGCGALPISDINPWWRKHHAALLPYSYDFRDQPISMALERIFADPAAAADIAWTSGEQERKTQPFDKAIADMVEFALAHRYFTFNYAPLQEVYIRHGA